MDTHNPYVQAFRNWQQQECAHGNAKQQGIQLPSFRFHLKAAPYHPQGDISKQKEIAAVFAGDNGLPLTCDMVLSGCNL